jgi:hypothetical protein
MGSFDAAVTGIAVEQRRAAARRALQRRAPRAACTQSGRSAAREREAPAWTIADRAARVTMRTSCSPHTATSQRRVRGAADYARPPSGCSTTITSSKSRSARFASICRRDSIGSCRSLPTATFAGYPRVFTCRLGVCGAHRQPLRPGGAAALRARLSERAASHDRRALGGRDHACAWFSSKTCSRAAQRIVSQPRRTTGSRCPRGPAAGRQWPNSRPDCAGARSWRWRAICHAAFVVQLAQRPARSGSDGDSGATRVARASTSPYRRTT